MGDYVRFGATTSTASYSGNLITPLEKEHSGGATDKLQPPLKQIKSPQPAFNICLPKVLAKVLEDGKRFLEWKPICWTMLSSVHLNDYWEMFLIGVLSVLEDIEVMVQQIEAGGNWIGKMIRIMWWRNRYSNVFTICPGINCMQKIDPQKVSTIYSL